MCQTESTAPSAEAPIRRTAILVGIGTFANWLVLGLFAPQWAAYPLAGIVPWNTDGRLGWTYPPLMVYVAIPFFAWLFKSRKLVYLTPIAPVCGAIIFVIRYLHSLMSFDM